jgi:hypothetical protein
MISIFSVFGLKEWSPEPKAQAVVDDLSILGAACAGENFRKIKSS